MDSTAMEVML
jgi:hypothetical protein